MLKCFELHITRTSKPLGQKEGGWSTYDVINKILPTLDDVKKEIAKYGIPEKCKKVKIHIDAKDNKPNHIGWIYCYKDKDWSHNSEWYFAEDWITIQEVEKTNFITNLTK